MSVKLRWLREVLIFLLIVGFGVFACAQVYFAMTDSVICAKAKNCFTFEASPFWFSFLVGVWSVVSVSIFGFLSVMVWLYRGRLFSEDIPPVRAPIDDAIRRDVKER